MPRSAPSAPPKPTTITPEQEKRLSAWFALKAQVAELAAREAEERQALFAELFPDAGEKGTYRVGVGHGKDLKAVPKLNYRVDRAALEVARAKLPPDVLDKVLRYRPEVVEAGLALVTHPPHRRLVDSFVVSSPGLPTLEIVDVKKGG